MARQVLLGYSGEILGQLGLDFGRRLLGEGRAQIAQGLGGGYEDQAVVPARPAGAIQPLGQLFGEAPLLDSMGVAGRLHGVTSRALAVVGAARPVGVNVATRAMRLMTKALSIEGRSIDW